MSYLEFPQIDPTIFSIGPLHVRWYGLMYVLGFIASYFLVKKQIREQNYTRLADHFENLNLILILCVVLGGRLGYVLFYNLPYFLEHPLEIPATWNGGMSFHGACIALFIGSLLYCKRQSLPYWPTADIYTVTFPLGIMFGRIGNFINGELFGRVTDAPLGMVFPGGGPLPRHPSQLYEATLEGAVLFLILWSIRKKPWEQKRYWPHGSMFSLFLICYGVFRITVENFREPDPQLGFLVGSLTMGQLLSSIMVLTGVVIWCFLFKTQNAQQPANRNKRGKAR